MTARKEYLSVNCNANSYLEMERGYYLSEISLLTCKVLRAVAIVQEKNT